IVAGHGDGPLSPKPLPLGLLIGGGNAAAIDFVGATILGYDPSRIPIARHAFDVFKFPIAGFSDRDVTLEGDLGSGRAFEILRDWSVPKYMTYPDGWRDAARVSAGEARKKHA